MFSSLRTKLVLSYVAIAALCLLLALLTTSVMAADYARRNGFRTLQEKKALALPYAQFVIAEELQIPANQRRVAPRQLLAKSARDSIRNSGLRLLLVDGDTMLVKEDTSRQFDATGKRFSLDDTVPNFSQLLTSGGVQGTRRLPGEDVTFQYIAQRVRLNRATTAAGVPLDPVFAIVVLAQPEPPQLQGLFREVIGYVFTAAAIALFVSLVAAYLLARSISRPVSRLAVAAAAMSHGDYEQRVPVKGRDELATLTQEFNDMASEVGKAHQMEKDFIANVSHDLKTPLTSIQGFSQAILDGTIKDEAGFKQAAGIINSEAEGMSRLVGRLLGLSRLQSGLATLELRQVELGPLLAQIALALQPQAIEAGVDLTAALDQTARVLADADRFKEAISNLVENAIKYTQQGGKVTITAMPAPDSVLIEVKDTGRGIPKDELPRVMERFYQVDKARSPVGGKSVGLGLAIAREIVLAHHGTITVNSQVGVGTTVSIQLPGPGQQASGQRVGRTDSRRKPAQKDSVGSSNTTQGETRRNGNHKSKETAYQEAETGRTRS